MGAAASVIVVGSGAFLALLAASYVIAGVVQFVVGIILLPTGA
jgi:hypothetical protein